MKVLLSSILIVSTDLFWYLPGVKCLRLARHKHGAIHGNSDKFVYLNERQMDYKEAKEECEKYGKALPFSSSVKEYSELIAFIQTIELKHIVWLPLRQNVFANWRWVSASHYNELPPMGQETKCGFIDYTSPNLRNTECSSLWLGYICQSQTAACESFRAGAKQLRVGKSCFRINHEKVNWYEARWRCHRENMDLAVIQNRDEEAQLRNGLRRTWKIFNVWQFWMGFYNSDWYIEDGTNESISSRAVFWDWEQPSSRGQCAVVERKNNLWRSADCSERHHAVCQEKPVTSTERQFLKHTTNLIVSAPVEEEHFKNRMVHLGPGGSEVWFCFWLTLLMSGKI